MVKSEREYRNMTMEIREAVEGEEDQAADGKGQLVGDVGHILKGLLGHADEQRGIDIVQIVDIQERAERVDDTIENGHKESPTGFPMRLSICILLMIPF